MDVDDETLDRLDLLERAATPRPWLSFNEEDGGLGGESLIQPEDSNLDIDIYAYLKVRGGDWHKAAKADQDFIAAARNALPDLISEVRRLRGA